MISIRNIAQKSGEKAAFAIPSADAGSSIELISYGDLAGVCDRWGDEIMKLVRPGACVALVARATPAAVATLFTLLDLPLRVVLIHPRWRENERAAPLAELRPALLIDPAAMLSLFAASPAEIAVRSQNGNLDCDRDVVVFSSGSTGIPRGVSLSHGAISASAYASEKNLGWCPEDRWLLSLPFAHVGGLSIVSRCLLAGKTVAFQSLDDDLLAACAKTASTLVSAVPTQLVRMCDADSENRAAALCSLRAVLVGGAPVAPALGERARALRIPILTTYGMTETCSQIATERLRARELSDERSGGLAIGPALPGIEIRISDPDDFGVGEIAVRGPVLSNGYVYPEIKPLPLDLDGYFHTGDRGRIDLEGNLQIIGRTDDLMISGGENVYPAEVEAALIATNEIRAACVFAIPDPIWGDRIVGIVQRNSDDSRSEEAIACAVCIGLAERIAPFRKPKELVVMHELPQNSAGKVDRVSARKAWLLLHESQKYEVRRDESGA